MSGPDRYRVKWSSRFKKDYQLAMKRGGPEPVSIVICSIDERMITLEETFEELRSRGADVGA